MELHDFLAARLDEDEAAAKAVKPLGYVFDMGARRLDEKFSHGRLRFASEDGRSHIEGDSAAAIHFALHDPARVLREVEAKRAILALHSVTVDRERVRDDSGQLVEEVAVSCDLCGWFAAVEGSGCMTIQLLAGAWSGHPDYDQDWKP